TTNEKVKSLALKAKVTRKQTSDDSDSQGGSDEDVDEEAEAFNMMAMNFRKFFHMGNWFKRGNQFSNGGTWSDSEDGDEHQNDATCLMSIDSQDVVFKPSSSNYDLNIIDLQKENVELLRFNKDFTKTFEKLLKEKCTLEDKNSKLSIKINDLEIEMKKLVNDKEVVEPCQKYVELTQEVCLKCDLLSDYQIVDSGCTKHMIRNRRLFTSYKLYDGGHVVFGSNLKGKVFGGGYSQTSKAYIVLNKETMRIEESLNVTFDESLPEPNSSSSVEDDRIEEPIVQDLNGSSSLQVNVSNEGYPKSLNEARGHPIEQVISELNERTLRSMTKQT
ncbi:hypothetical protein Tco_0717591, partial [Tanacetum coccineum]